MPKFDNVAVDQYVEVDLTTANELVVLRTPTGGRVWYCEAVLTKTYTEDRFNAYTPQATKTDIVYVLKRLNSDPGEVRA